MESCSSRFGSAMGRARNTLNAHIRARGSTLRFVHISHASRLKMTSLLRCLSWLSSKALSPGSKMKMGSGLHPASVDSMLWQRARHLHQSLAHLTNN
jgi:hypothetical protein